MTTQTEALKLADAYANARAGWYVESLYGTSKGYTAEKQREMQEAHAALVKALAQPEQKPVGEVSKAAFGDYPVICWRTDYVAKIGDKFYTTPPQRTWVGLTEEDMDWLHENTPCIEGNYGYRFIKAIEAKLKEKNTTTQTQVWSTEEALTLALEALESFVQPDSCEHGFWWEDCPNDTCEKVKDMKTITVIKDALEAHKALNRGAMDSSSNVEAQPTNCRHCGGDANTICAGQCKTKLKEKNT